MEIVQLSSCVNFICEEQEDNTQCVLTFEPAKRLASRSNVTGSLKTTCAVENDVLPYTVCSPFILIRYAYRLH